MTLFEKKSVYVINWRISKLVEGNNMCLDPTTLSQFLKHLENQIYIQGYDPYGGNCLDIAVGCALAIQHSHPVGVALLTRPDDDEDNSEILSHAVIEHNGQFYDGGGINAVQRWKSDFNIIQRCNDDPTVDFDCELYSDHFVPLHEQCQSRFIMKKASPPLVSWVRNYTMTFLMSK